MRYHLAVMAQTEGRGVVNKKSRGREVRTNSGSKGRKEMLER